MLSAKWLPWECYSPLSCDKMLQAHSHLVLCYEFHDLPTRHSGMQTSNGKLYVNPTLILHFAKHLRLCIIGPCPKVNAPSRMYTSQA